MQCERRGSPEKLAGEGSLVAGRGKNTQSEGNLQDRLYGGVHGGAEGGESSGVGWSFKRGCENDTVMDNNRTGDKKAKEGHILKAKGNIYN
ncbi:hypothetical protein TSUD_300900 [Trifolium subterraneum]|uniref:Uncharacterized protein n=1 Tax=Trifolium subterraneum TaxID=3900 RepID=A0A2Z6NMG1_TRISU|nr:hypothetical protein TSUD_300900 [Trifolium subterraneum]